MTDNPFASGEAIPRLRPIRLEEKKYRWAKRTIRKIIIMGDVIITYIFMVIMEILGVVPGQSGNFPVMFHFISAIFVWSILIKIGLLIANYGFDRVYVVDYMVNIDHRMRTEREQR